MTFKITAASIILAISHIAFSEIAVVVHPSNTQDLNKDDVKKIFLGKTKSFSSGKKIAPFNLSTDRPERETFESGILNKNAKQMKTYWSKIIFTGKGSPPAEKNTSESLKSSIASNPNSIGYLKKEDVDSSVKVVLTF